MDHTESNFQCESAESVIDPNLKYAMTFSSRELMWLWWRHLSDLFDVLRMHIGDWEEDARCEETSREVKRNE